jgi:CDP-glucose 4,6-dehydratase
MTADILRAYAGRRVLLTGHTGFKGGWLAAWLTKAGAVVTGYSLAPTTTPNLFSVASIGDLVRSVIGDVRDLGQLLRAWRDARPDVVFHLAAQPIVRLSYQDPLETLQTNVMGTANILEAARREAKPVALVLVTSDKCYENREWVFGYRENDRLGGHDIYSASKGAAEIVVSSYRRSFFPPETIDQHGIGIATARAGNVIGGGDWSPDRIVPDSMRALAAGQSVAVRNPDATRPWQHVLEPLSGYLTVGTRLLGTGDRRAEACDSWNFGPDPTGTRSVRDLVEHVIARYGKGEWHQAGTRGPHEAGLLRLATDKARTRLGWAPRWNFDETIAATVDWYRAFDAGESMRDWCERQIDAYARAGGP